MKRKLIWVFCVVLACLLLAGCSQGSSTGASSSAGEGSSPKTAQNDETGSADGSSQSDDQAKDAPSADAAQSVDATQPADGAASAIAAPSSSGRLKVEGAQLVSETGAPVQLRGVSTHGLAWFPQYVNQDFFDELRSDWGANVVRLALYTADFGGYCTNGDKGALMDLLADGVEFATASDLYVIVDWHILSDGNPLEHKDEALAFFGELSARYANYDNVVYEICNEPNGSTTWEDVKVYANEVIPVIRENAPDALIIVGTPNWSQDVDLAAADPLGFDNLMYSLHFYAATHKDDLRSKLQSAHDAGLPVFVSEFGVCDASGAGQLDYDSANAWVSLLDELDISYVCWNLSNKDEASALFGTACAKASGFTLDDLSAEGTWLKALLSR